MAITVSPSKLSAELRAALDLPAGAPPPWQARLLAFGLPIDYRVPDFETEKPETVEQAVPKVETRLSSQTGHEQQQLHTVVADDAFRVRLGPKFATVFGEQRQLAPTSNAPHASATAQTHHPHIPNSMGARPDMSTFYEDPGPLRDPSKLTAQAGVSEDNTGQATPPRATSAKHARGSHSEGNASAGADVAQPQQSSCASDGPALAEESAPALPGLSSAKPGSSTTRLRGSGWHGDEKRSKSRKRSHASKTWSPQHGTAHRRPAGQPTTTSQNSDHARPRDENTVAAQAQPEHGPQAAAESGLAHFTAAGSRPLSSAGPNAGPITDMICRTIESDDDDVIYVRTAQHWRHEIMDLVSDEDRPDDQQQMSVHHELLDEGPAIPVMETLHHDGRSTCQGAVVAAPQLQTFTQAEDVSPHTPQRRFEPAQPDLNPATPKDGLHHQKSHTNQESNEPSSKANDTPGAEPTGATTAPERAEHEDLMAEPDQEGNMASHKSRSKSTDRSRSYSKSKKSSKSRSKHRTTHEKERSRYGSAERDPSRHEPRERRHRDDDYDRERDRRYHEPHGRRHREDDEDLRAHKRHHRDRRSPPASPRRGRWSPAESMSPRGRAEYSPRWRRSDASGHDDHWRAREWRRGGPAAARRGDASPEDEHWRRQDRQRRGHGAASRAAAADRHTRASAEEGGGAARQPRASAAPAPAAEPARGQPEHGTPWRTEGAPVRGSGDSPAGDVRAGGPRVGGVRGQGPDGQHRQVSVRFTTHPSPGIPGVASPEQAPQQKNNDHSAPRDTPARKGGDARVGQFLPRRTGSGEVQRQPVMPRQGSAGEASKKQPESVGGFLARSDSATKAPVPAAKAPVPADPPGTTGHFLVRRDSAPAGPARAARESEPPAKQTQAVSSAHARKQVEKGSPVKQAAVQMGQSTAAVGWTGGPGESTVSPVPGKQSPKQPTVSTAPKPQAAVIKNVEPKNDDDVWFTPAGESEQGPLFTSPFEYWGINAPLKGADTFRHKKQWMQADFLPVQLTHVLLRNCEARIKLFFAISNRG